MDFETLGWASLLIKTVRIVQDPSFECYMSTRVKQGSVKHGSGLRSGHKGNVILPNTESLHSLNVTRALGVFLGVRIPW